MKNYMINVGSGRMNQPDFFKEVQKALDIELEVKVISRCKNL